MKTLKISLLGAIFLFSVNSFAQTSYGVRGGLNLADVSLKASGIGIDASNIKPGFHIGAFMDHSLTNIFAFETGLMLETKGSKIKANKIGGTTGEAVTNIWYLDIPINLKASYDLGGVGIYGLFGPYVGFALSAKDKYTGDFKDLEGVSEYDNNIGSSDDDDLKRMDFGLAMGAGVEIDKFQFGLGYNLGLANIQPGGDSDNFVKNRVFKISVGLMLGK